VEELAKELFMKIQSILSLVAVSAFATAPLCHAEEIFCSPIALFKEAYVPAMQGCFAASLKKTLRGFILRGDSTSDKAEARLPSDEGISLDVAVRDAVEIPEFRDLTTVEGNLTTRSVRFPAFPPGQPIEQSQGLVVTLVYGSKASPEALNAMTKCIDSIKQRTGQE
jgi:hypothetical protein